MSKDGIKLSDIPSNLCIQLPKAKVPGLRACGRFKVGGMYKVPRKEALDLIQRKGFECVDKDKKPDQKLNTLVLKYLSQQSKQRETEE